jgi:predicted DNA-binding transcriptional regulator AlpA
MMKTGIEKKSMIYLKEVEAAKVLNMNKQTLANWRYQGRGPAYIKLGKAVRYQYADIEKFITENRICPQ